MPVPDLSEFVQAGPTRNDRHPKGWTPRVDTERGVIVVQSSDPEPPGDWDEIIEQFSMDPTRWEVVSDRVHVRTWDTNVGGGELVRSFYYKADLRPRRQRAFGVDELVAKVSKWRPRTTTKGVAEGTFVVPVGDLQLGKSDNGGTPAIVDNFLAEIERAAQRLRQANGRKAAASIFLPWLGDCIEGLWSQNKSLRMRLDLTATEQVRVYRHLMLAQVKLFAPLAERLVIPVVPGNHDEAVREGGKMASFCDDSWAIEGASAVMAACNENPELREKVEFVFPGHDQLTITLEVDGTYIGMAHGHQFAGGADGWRKWWNDQAGGRTPIGMADVLLAAHLHHLRIQDHGDGRLFLQIPALDGGSNWFKHRRGEASPPRIVTFFTKDGHVWGLDPVTTKPEGVT